MCPRRKETSSFIAANMLGGNRTLEKKKKATIWFTLRKGPARNQREISGPEKSTSQPCGVKGEKGRDPFQKREHRRTNGFKSQEDADLWEQLR